MTDSLFIEVEALLIDESDRLGTGVMDTVGLRGHADSKVLCS
ncbi:MAG: hypothetical protein ACRCSP_07880 [Rhodoglobus sp.]